MKRVENGAFVKLCYTGTLENGVVFDKTDMCKPIEIQVGDGSLVQGFEKEIKGMGVNEKKSFVLEPNEAYGERDEKLERTFSRSELALKFEPFPGQVILFMSEEGHQFPALVKFVDEDVIIADFNHPLAGRNLAFDVEVAEISETKNDPLSGCSAECCCA